MASAEGVAAPVAAALGVKDVVKVGVGGAGRLMLGWGEGDREPLADAEALRLGLGVPLLLRQG